MTEIITFSTRKDKLNCKVLNKLFISNNQQTTTCVSYANVEKFYFIQDPTTVHLGLENSRYVLSK